MKRLDNLEYFEFIAKILEKKFDLKNDIYCFSLNSSFVVVNLAKINVDVKIL